MAQVLLGTKLPPVEAALGPQFLAELAAATTAAGDGVSSGEAIKEASPRGG